MSRLSLRKIRKNDKKFFTKWWKDRDLIRLTSGVFKKISKKDVDSYFSFLLESKENYHFLIILNNKIIGHISLSKRRNDWYEVQIIIGNKKYWGKGFGSKAITLLLQKAIKNKILKIYLEVRPDNLRAIRAYEKCGFKKYRLIKNHNNRYLQEILVMRLKIQNRT